jgi:hypothetical protein
MDEINLFESFMTRKSSINFKILVSKYNEKIESIFGIIDELNIEFNKTVNDLCSYLFDEVKRNDRDRMELITIKRRIYNKKTIESTLIDRFKGDNFLFNNLVIYVQQYNEIKKNQELVLQMADKYNTQFIKHMLKEVTRKSFKKAVMISSFSLYKNLCSIKDLKEKKRKDLESGVLKYYLRSASKTSPFSYFTTVELNEFKTKTSINLQNSYAKVNVNILKYILKLINNNYQLRMLLPLKLNTTIHNYNSNILYLDFQSGQSVINKIKKTEFIDLIFALFETKNKVTYKDLKRVIMSKYSMDIDIFNRIFIDLFNNKFLIFDFDVSIYKNWIVHLQHKLKLYKSHSELIFKIDKLLKVFCRLENKFSKATLKLRESLLIDSFSKLISFCYEVDDSIEKSMLTNNQINVYETYKFGDFKFRIENLIFEDVISKGNENIDQNLTEKVCNDLNDIIKVISINNIDKDVSLKIIKEIMKNKFNNCSENILPVFFEYQKKFRKKENKEMEINSNKLLSNFHVDINQTEVKVKLKDEVKNESKILEHTSFNAYLQFCQEEVKNKKLVVVNGVYPGYGKMFSRFMNHEDVSEINKFRDFNLLGSDLVLCENHENSYFNGNIHPMLVDLEIKNYDGNNSISGEKVKNLKQLKIHKNDEEVKVVDDQNRRVLFVDLGFQISSLHSDFFKFLNSFTPNMKNNYSPLIKAINKKTHINNGSIKCFPRIFYNENIVLQRKFWIIDKGSFNPFLNLQESHVFIEINSWRKKLMIPNIVYVTLNINQDLLNEYKNDLHKPFLVDFYNSTLIYYLLRQISNKVLSIKISEMLPDYSKVNNVKEFLVQWKNI